MAENEAAAADMTVKIRKSDVEPEKQERIIKFTTNSIGKFQIEKVRF